MTKPITFERDGITWMLIAETLMYKREATEEDLRAAGFEREQAWTPGHASPDSSGIGNHFLCLLERDINSVPMVMEYSGCGYFVDPNEPEELLFVESWRPLPSAPEQTKETP